MKKLIILLTLLAACTQDEPKDFQLAVLAPVTSEFSTGADRNRIDYFYVSGNFSYKKEAYEKLKKKIQKEITNLQLNKYHLYSVYVYKETNVIGKNFSGEREALDGHTQDMLAYVRFNKGKIDVFYITDKGKVVYDLLLKREENFEFE